MTREEIFSRIETLAKKIFGPETIIDQETNAADLKQWDSMNHVQLIAAVEKEFNITFDIMEIIGIAKFGDFVDLIEKKQG